MDLDLAGFTRAGGEDVDVRIGMGHVPELFDEMIATAAARDHGSWAGGNVASQFADAGLLDELW